MRDIGMQVKGLEYSHYVSKESLAQQGGYGLANKGPQHDEAWLIFMDTVNGQIRTIEDKAEALHYFPLFRTWFGLMGLCKLPWSDVVPDSNAETSEPIKVPDHVRNYLTLYAGIVGREITEAQLLEMSEAVYTFQRVFSLRMGRGRRADDMPPYRSMGPVTREEYESRAERYDTQLRESVGVEPQHLTIDEKIAALRAWRQTRYDRLVDAVYARRGWTADGVPTLDTLRRLHIDFPWVLDVVAPHLENERTTVTALARAG
jgi:aldehyde:ferredoxin oxidoreductase